MVTRMNICSGIQQGVGTFLAMHANGKQKRRFPLLLAVSMDSGAAASNAFMPPRLPLLAALWRAVQPASSAW